MEDVVLNSSGNICSVDDLLHRAGRYLDSQNVILEDVLFTSNSFKLPGQAVQRDPSCVFGKIDLPVSMHAAVSRLAADFVNTDDPVLRRNILALVGFSPVYEKNCRLIPYEFFTALKPNLEEASEDAQGSIGKLLANNPTILLAGPNVWVSSYMDTVFSRNNWVWVKLGLERVCTLARYTDPGFVKQLLAPVPYFMSLLVPLLLEGLDPAERPSRINSLLVEIMGLANFMTDTLSVPSSVFSQSLEAAADEAQANDITLPDELAVRVLEHYSMDKGSTHMLVQYLSISPAAVVQFMAENPKIARSKHFLRLVNTREDAVEIMGINGVHNPSSVARIQFALNARISEAEKLVYDKVPEVRMQLALRAELSPDVQAILVLDPDPAVRENLARNPAVGSRIAESLASDPSSAVRSTFAASIGRDLAQNKVMGILASDVSHQVLRALVTNHKIPHEAFSVQVSKQILGDPYLPSDVLYSLASICRLDIPVWELMLANLKRQCLPSQTLAKKVASNANAYPETLEMLYHKFTGRDVQRLLLANPSLPGSVRLMENLSN